MAMPRPEKKREPQAAADTKILSMEFQLGDRIVDENRRVGSDRSTVHDGRREDGEAGGATDI